MGIISFRVDKAEIQRIREETRARGFLYVSELVREKLGLPPGQGKTAPSPMMEKIDQEVRDPIVAGVLREMNERLDQIIRLDNAIARHVGAPKDAGEKKPAGQFGASLRKDPVEEAGFDR